MTFGDYPHHGPGYPYWSVVPPWPPCWNQTPHAPWCRCHETFTVTTSDSVTLNFGDDD